MDPKRSAQVVLLCDVCESSPLQRYCERCNVNLCYICEEKHRLDSSKRHKIVDYINRKTTQSSTRCPKHKEHCKLYCEDCNIPVCSICVSGKHNDHDVSDILQKFKSMTRTLQKELEELETRIHPRYEEMLSDVHSQKTELETNYASLTTAAEHQGELLHQEVNAIVNQRKCEIQEMKNKHLSTLNKNTEEITKRVAELKQIILDLKSIIKSNDVFKASAYKSGNSEFRTLPPKVRATLPRFSPRKLNKYQLNEMFGSLSPLSIKIEHGGTMKSPEALLSPSINPPLPEQRIIATIDTGQKYLIGVSCLSDEDIWACGNDKIMKLLNLKGKLQTSIKTKSENEPQDIAVTRGGHLVYTDTADKTVNLVKSKKIQRVFRSEGWAPHFLCSTASDDLLITMISDDKTKSKVARYSGSTETQTIQFDDQGRPLYSSGDIKCMYISENRNLDICVADNKAKAIVVVSQLGKFRFRYNGERSDIKKSFDPIGITTDSQSHILIADFINDRIHIIDQDGQFLRYIENCGLQDPHGLSVDTKDNLFVVEHATAKVKKIQYL